MTGKRSLRQVLAGQWIAFSLTLFALAAGMALLLLYMLEDSFIDRRLEDVADTVVRIDREPALPADFRLFPADALPPDLHERLQDAAPGDIREFRLPDGRYVHAFHGRARNGTRFVLVYDVTDQLTVNQAIGRGLPLLVAMAAVLALCAYVLARAFVARISRQARALVGQLRDSQDPERLQMLARAEPIAEFSEFARLSATAWQQKIEALDRERETVAFLGHELRTPLQSARTSLTLLQDDRGNVVAWQRLQRAVDRLVRASNGMLWLASDAPATELEATDAGSLLAGLIEEFAPLAAARAQVVIVRQDAAEPWPLPPEVVEVVLANLLLNAIQHGDSGRIEAELSGSEFRLSNLLSVQSAPGGFGLGLQVVRRLLERFGWSLSREERDGRSFITARSEEPNLRG